MRQRFLKGEKIERKEMIEEIDRGFERQVENYLRDNLEKLKSEYVEANDGKVEGFEGFIKAVKQKAKLSLIQNFKTNLNNLTTENVPRK